MYHSLLAHLLNGILVVFKFITALLIIPQTFTCMLLCGHKFQTALGKYQGQQLLDCMVRVWQFLTKLNTTKSSRVLFCYFVSPSIVTEKSYCSTSLSAFGAVSVLAFHHFNRCVVVLTVIVSCHSLMTCSVSFLCLFVICMSFW